MLSRFSSVQLFVTLWTITHQPPLCPWDSSGKNTGVGCHALLQGIFPSLLLGEAFIYENSLDSFLHMVRNPSWKSEVLIINRKLHLIPRILEEK